MHLIIEYTTVQWQIYNNAVSKRLVVVEEDTETYLLIQIYLLYRLLVSQVITVHHML